MDRTGRRSQPAISPYDQVKAEQRSIWRPFIRRLRQGFRFKENPRIFISNANAASTLSPLDETAQQNLTARGYQILDDEHDTSIGFQHSRGISREYVQDFPKAPNQVFSKRSSFIKRSLTRFKKHSKQHEKQEQRSRRHTMPSRATATADTSQHGSNTIALSSRHTDQNFQSNRPVTAPYIPTHAATDFSRLNVEGRLSLYGSRSKRSSQITHHDQSSVLRSTTLEKEEDSVDYQDFIARSRAEAARALEAREDRDQVNEPRQRAETDIKRRSGIWNSGDSISRHNSHRLSRSASVFDRVGSRIVDYVKPGDLQGSGYVQSKRYSAFVGDSTAYEAADSTN